MAEYLEIERKFDVDTDFARPDFGAVPGVTAADPVIHHLSATYFDTPDQRLLTAKVTLRRRTGGADEGWHMKLPMSADTRRELREPLSEELPAPLAARVAEVTGGVPVAPIAILHTERTVVTLHANGAVVAEIADDVVIARRLSGSRDPLQWREIEVEVPQPCPPVQQATAELLAGAGARPSRSASKLARVLNA